MSKAAIAEFSHADHGLTRFPPNVEKISVRHETTHTWLIMRRNDTELKFPLRRIDCEHLIKLLDGEPIEAA